jgi:hypothetical protein
MASLVDASPTFAARRGRSLESLAVWTLAALAVALLVATYVRSIGAVGVDYVAYFDAGNWVREGQRLYERSLTWRDVGYAPEYPMPMPLGMQFVYPPVFAVAFAPFTMLSLDGAFAVWLGVLFAALIAAIWVLVSTLLPQARPYRLQLALILAAVAAVFNPVRTIFITGQVDLIILLLLALALRSFLRRQDVLTGVLLAAAIAIKPTIGFFVLFLLWKRAYRAAIVCCGLAGALLLLPFGVAGGLPTLLDYAAVSSYLSSAGFDVSPINQSPFGMLLRLFTINAYTVPLVVAPIIPTIGRAVITLGTLATLALLVRRSRSVSVTRQSLEFALMVVGLLIAGPLSEAGHYGYLLLPFAAVGAAVYNAAPGRGRLIGAAALVGLFAYLSLPSLTPIDCMFFEYWQGPVGGARVALSGMHLYGLLGVALLTVVALLKVPQPRVNEALNPSPTPDLQTAVQTSGSFVLHG